MPDAAPVMSAVRPVRSQLIGTLYSALEYVAAAMSDWQAWQQQPPTSGAATAALVLGICGLVVCPFVCSILALVFGYRARDEIDSSGGQLGGRSSAVAGIVLGWVGIGLVVAGLALVLLVLAAAGGVSVNEGVLIR
jgi:hypothetical protein